MIFSSVLCFQWNTEQLINYHLSYTSGQTGKLSFNLNRNTAGDPNTLKN